MFSFLDKEIRRENALALRGRRQPIGQLVHSLLDEVPADVITRSVQSREEQETAREAQQRLLSPIDRIRTEALRPEQRQDGTQRLRQRRNSRGVHLRLPEDDLVPEDVQQELRQTLGGG